MSSILNFKSSGGGSSSDDLSGASGESSPSDSGVFDNPYVEAVFCYGWVLVLFYCVLCKRSGSSARSTAVGDRIRQRAREAHEQMERQKLKKAQTPDQRKKLVDESLQTKRVLSKDDQGNLTLGDTAAKPVDPPVSASDEKKEGENFDIETASSPTGEESSPTSNTGMMDDVDEDQTCVICLDLFERGDTVSWSRTNEACTHVFHTECIRPWLEEKRQDECPSCRSTLICYSCGKDDQSDDKKVEKGKNGNDENDCFEEESLFVIVRGLISRAAIDRINQHAPSLYDLVSVNSSSFDSQDSSRSEESQESSTDGSANSSDDEEESAEADAEEANAGASSSSSSDGTQVVDMTQGVSDVSSLQRTAIEV